VPRDDLDKLNANLIDLQGVDVIPTPRRNYRYGPLASHVLGYMSEIGQDELENLPEDSPHYEQGDYIGRRGLERRYERDLKGKDGIERIVVDARGNRIDAKVNLIKEDQRIVPAQPGDNLVLSLDVRLQEAAERAFPGKAGSIVVLDVHTGDVLALVSKPGFDPNQMSGRITREALRALFNDRLQPMIFRATQQQYNPGSTFKSVTALAALEGNFIKAESSITCTGGYQLGKRRWRCDAESGHGPMELKEAIAASCDVYFYALGDRMGIEPIANMAHAMGLGAPTGLDLGYETPGVVPSKEWHDRYTPGGYQKGFALNTAIGQGDTNVTPMQLAVLYAAIANGGTLYKPHLIRRFEDASGHVLREIEPEVQRHLPVTPAHLKNVVEGLKAVVNQPGGTAYWSRPADMPVLVAGKTGTAQVGAIGEKRIKENDLEYWRKSNSWFASFAPADNPEIAVVVLNEHGGFGASAAAPAAFEVIRAYFQLKQQDLAQSQPQVPGLAPLPLEPLPRDAYPRDPSPREPERPTHARDPDADAHADAQAVP
jgi:penicillin-binding protein 2